MQISFDTQVKNIFYRCAHERLCVRKVIRAWSYVRVALYVLGVRRMASRVSFHALVFWIRSSLSKEEDLILS